jgi:hypothetical protein
MHTLVWRREFKKEGIVQSSSYVFLMDEQIVVLFMKEITGKFQFSVTERIPRSRQAFGCIPAYTVRCSFGGNGAWFRERSRQS